MLQIKQQLRKTFKSKFERIDAEDAASANTEDDLLSSKASSETISEVSTVPIQTICYPRGRDIRTKCYDPRIKLCVGAIFLLWGASTLLWPPFDVMMRERLQMRPGFPPYEWWKSPPDEVLLRVYIFNITNAESFINGEDSKLNLEEIGPIVFREKLYHSNVTFNENETMTYVATRKAIFLSDQNVIDLNRTITVPNFGLLGMASYFWDAPFYQKWAYNMLVRSSKSNATVNISIYNYLWNFTDPIIDMARKIAPKMVPVNNMGILSRIYDDFEDTVNVFIGSKYGNENYFLIDKYDGSERLPNHGDACDDTVTGSTEGVAYPQFLTKNSTVRYWRKTMCRVTPLYFEREASNLYGVQSYRFKLPSNIYHRTNPAYNDCYKGEPALPDGLSDVSKCYFDIPMAASNPHFLHGDAKLKDYVTGLNPQESKHESFVYIEPITGIPLNSRARSQSNLVIRKLEGFKDELNRFSEIVLPMFWAEYNQVGLPWYISGLMYFTVNVMPTFQKIFTAVLLTIGLLLVALTTNQMLKPKSNHLLTNKIMRYEKETFIK